MQNVPLKWKNVLLFRNPHSGLSENGVPFGQNMQKSSLRKKRASQRWIRAEEIILQKKRASQRWIRKEEIIPAEKKSKIEMKPGEEIIPAEQKSTPEMNPGGRNHPCGTKEQARDESGRKKSSLWNKRASQRWIRGEEIIPAEEKSKPEMNPSRRNHPCGTKDQARDESGRKK